ncbi:deoxyribose-phosphate aldolase [Nocardia rhizosphaerihabitans]|uniref:Deoxyribose-phosphate aldolase n=2 Tax=Nocardia rhizosphaerihabitans TaxID=1691570 RepID=A0ABQ2K981_9NOCA|nr:deoxyribose-phosphate aldolase [Nocardia rhizosphaerihabitans]
MDWSYVMLPSMTVSTPLTRADVAAMIDHTLLAPEATPAEVEALIAEARKLGVYAICVSPSMLPLRAPGLVVATVAGFPSGKHHSLVKGAEARLAVDQGAAEIDMVIDVGAALAGDFNAVLSDVITVREATTDRGVVLKVIIESAALTDEAIVGACRAAEQGGADFVKTSTGFHPAGGASVHAVRLMAETVGGRLGVKASGGIRTAEDAAAMIAAGATRLGLSKSAAVLAGFAE